MAWNQAFLLDQFHQNYCILTIYKPSFFSPRPIIDRLRRLFLCCGGLTLMTCGSQHLAARFTLAINSFSAVKGVHERCGTKGL
jgi:hypothetical protein